MYDELFELLKKIDGKCLIAIDGNCGSGKTQLAKEIEKELHIPVVHIDYFYLPFVLRKPDWKETAGGNMDFERLKAQVLDPFKENKEIHYYHFDQFKQAEAEWYDINSNILIVEGSYSMHPWIKDYFNYCIFLKCDHDHQISRLQKREGDHFSAFSEIWINKEKDYFKEFEIEKEADIVIDTTTLF